MPKGKTTVAVAPANRRAALDAATRRIIALKETIEKSFHELGRELARVRDEKLYEAKGHETLEAYLEKEVRFSRTTAFKLMRISERFTEKAARELGLERLEAAARLMDATPEEEDPGKVAAIAIPVGKPKAGGGRARTKPLAEATAEEIRAAARAQKEKKGRTDGRARPAAAEDLAATSEKSLHRAGLKTLRIKARKAPKEGDGEGDGSGFVIDVLGLEPDLAKKAVAFLVRNGRG